MQKYLKNALIFLIIIFALLAVMASLTNATEALNTTDPLFLSIAVLFFISSVVVWLISWAFLIKKRSKVPLRGSLFLGFSAVYAALTPIQLGADLLRALSLKKYFGVPYKDSIAASMVVKGAKFSLIAIFSSFVIVMFLLSAKTDFFLLTGLLSGFIVVLLATALFLLPLNKNFGLSIAGIFQKISRFVPLASKAEKFFVDYSDYLSLVGNKNFLVVAFLSGLSLLLEFLALLFCFYALSLNLPFISIALLFILIAILERTPFLPRGIGIVEGVGFAYLSLPALATQPISIAKIGALLIIFDFVRLVVPSLLSMLVYIVFASKQKSDYSKQL
ncbi:MAG: hypothetical protein CL943_02815 [Candidatus Diapherotrites archaeon]|uniref:Flippase-like domain-containing protein n=1 Tax=Candidatus Iainarchaeum sp. TaxID=3101447 RepID=A0A2D6M1B8_9ARCH|nr:hypothetical protein [Candidatus Diapherotrites archaeon]|tara:strand:- start:249 stop:1244 length:996 start_codon:yes stop_codon:yes gene_type:complete